jgi:hypothetical protein
LLQHTVTHWGTGFRFFVVQHSYYFHIGDFNYLTQQNAGASRTAFITLATTATAAIVQSFLIYRHWKMLVFLLFLQRPAFETNIDRANNKFITAVLVTLMLTADVRQPCR